MNNNELQRQARALGDPTRYRLFRYIAESSAPVGVRELTDLVALNHNAVRQHLAVLKDTALVAEELEERGLVGRPRLLYRLDPEVAGRWDTPGPYAWLAGLLSQAITTKQEPRQVGRQHGHQLAVEVAGTKDPIDLLEGEMVKRGFRPAKVVRGNRVEFVLGRCPFAEVAISDPSTVCGLHLGLAEGLAEGLGDLEVERLVAKAPRRAGCRLVVRQS